jgi:hypothetical protein
LMRAPRVEKCDVLAQHTIKIRGIIS